MGQISHRRKHGKGTSIVIKESPFIGTGDSMREITETTKKAVRDAKSTVMVIYMWADMNRIKSTEKEHFIGSVFAMLLEQSRSSSRWNNTKECGGEGFLMEKDSTRRPMVLHRILR